MINFAGWTYDAARFRVGLRFGAAQRAEDGESGGKMFEGVRFGSATGHVKQLPEEKHRGVGFARPAASGQDDGLRVARLRLLPHSFLDDTHQLRLLYNVAGAGQR